MSHVFVDRSLLEKTIDKLMGKLSYWKVRPRVTLIKEHSRGY